MTTCPFYDVNYLDSIGDIEKDIEFIEIKKKIIMTDNQTQTQTDIINNEFPFEIDVLKSEIESLKIKNSRLEKNFKDISNLLVMFTKIDIKNPEVDKIRRQLTILVNRELRMNYAFPFVNLLSNIK